MLSNVPFEIPAYLLERARALPKMTVAVAGAGNPIALESVRQAAEADLVEPILVGDPDDIRDSARSIGWDLAGCRIEAADSEAKASEKAVALCRHGEAALLMKGHVHTDEIMRAVIDRENGLRTGRRTSHVFHMTIPGCGRVIHITDAAINVNPNTDSKIDIVHNAIDMARALGMEQPKVAVLSGAETINPSMPSSVDADKVVSRMNSQPGTRAIIDGPLGFDNAVSAEAAKIKGIDSPVAGQADILVVPNLESGNFLFKQMVYFMSSTAAGVVMGAQVPIVLTSRADPPEARFAATAIAAIIAADKESEC
jgi:phosphate acetyltransferase